MTADRLFVCRQVAGQLAIEQIGREVFLESGDITLSIRWCLTPEDFSRVRSYSF
jgi:hypothetical protein